MANKPANFVITTFLIFPFQLFAQWASQPIANKTFHLAAMEGLVQIGHL